MEEMKKAGWGPTHAQRWKWGRIEGGYYAAPARYRALLRGCWRSTSRADAGAAAGRPASSRDEPIPPQYQELVDRYHKVLATEGKAKAGERGRMTK